MVFRGMHRKVRCPMVRVPEPRERKILRASVV